MFNLSYKYDIDPFNSEFDPKNQPNGSWINWDLFTLLQTLSIEVWPPECVWGGLPSADRVMLYLTSSISRGSNQFVSNDVICKKVIHLTTSKTTSTVRNKKLNFKFIDIEHAWKHKESRSNSCSLSVALFGFSHHSGEQDITLWSRIRLYGVRGHENIAFMNCCLFHLQVHHF